MTKKQLITGIMKMDDNTATKKTLESMNVAQLSRLANGQEIHSVSQIMEGISASYELTAEDRATIEELTTKVKTAHGAMQPYFEQLIEEHLAPANIQIKGVMSFILAGLYLNPTNWIMKDNGKPYSVSYFKTAHSKLTGQSLDKAMTIKASSLYKSLNAFEYNHRTWLANGKDGHCVLKGSEDVAPANRATITKLEPLGKKGDKGFTPEIVEELPLDKENTMTSTEVIGAVAKITPDTLKHGVDIIIDRIVSSSSLSLKNEKILMLLNRASELLEEEVLAEDTVITDDELLAMG